MSTTIAAIFYDKDTGMYTGDIRPDNYWEIAELELPDNQLKLEVSMEQFDTMSSLDKQNYVYAQTGIIAPTNSPS